MIALDKDPTTARPVDSGAAHTSGASVVTDPRFQENRTMLRKDITFEHAGPAVTQGEIDALKAALGGIALPTDYERYLLRFNGANPTLTSGDPDRPPILRLWWPAGSAADVSDHAGTLASFYRITGQPETASNLLQTHQDIGHLLPPQTFAFVGDGGGGRYVFDLRPDRFGEVLFWSYQALGSEEDAASDPYHNVAWVASDFIDFINRMERSPTDWNAWEMALPPDSDKDWHPR
ncbi:SMI1/KNR4 family protein [Rhizobacter sp. Root1221]|uniref:SMI1/KNR4 family protein n=1 Tax=Rhizobacter sp. Root1221 TaxID=1736433 RepID=UPI000701B2EA|nr:SMI1/KNR4 family protein [Rhizobacter sp. Root1221]KQW03093.1 hypothetical protein ASC87_01815 [Rhizobacter sp. Root1221]